jgi:uncharacterized membrane protein required for colicin V production
LSSDSRRFAFLPRQFSLAFLARRFIDGTMIAALIPTSAGSRMLFNWFDVAVVLLIMLGFWRGRKRGMSRDFLPAGFWFSVVIAGGFGYERVGNWAMSQPFLRQIFGNGLSNHTTVYVSSYLLIALVAFAVFQLLKQFFKKRLAGGNAFGGGEYYLGTMAGIVRYLCIGLAALALINAPYYSAADIAATEAYNNRWYGGGLKEYSGDFIPDLQEVQASIFRDSRLGPLIKHKLGLLLINTTQTAPGTAPSAI